MKRGLIKHFHLAVGGLNTKLVEEFECGTEPAGVARRVANVLVPAIHILQERTNRQGPGSKDAVLLEEVRERRTIKRTTKKLVINHDLSSGSPCTFF